MSFFAKKRMRTRTASTFVFLCKPLHTPSKLVTFR